MIKEDFAQHEELNRSIEACGVSIYLKRYISLLLVNLQNFVGENFEPLSLVEAPDYPIENCLSQKIIGNYIAYTAIEGSRHALICFAESYGKAGITEFDYLAKDSLCDFLNLQNGLFAVELSKDEKLELSLEVPSAFHEDNQLTRINTYILPVNFSFGTVRFILSEARLRS